MNQILQILFKLILIFLGITFFLIMLFVGMVALVLFGLRQLWYKITGRHPQPSAGFRFNPMDGFTYFYSRTTKTGPDMPRPSQRPLDDVSDVEIKAITKPDDIDQKY